MSTDFARLENVDEVLNSLPQRFNPDSCQDLAMAVHWKLTGDEERQFTILVDHGSFSLQQGPFENADIEMETDSQVYLKLVNGDMKGLVAVMTRRLKVKGNLQLTTRWDQIFN